MKDYYQILGLQKGASRDEVKKAFRKLSSQFPPDKKTGDENKYKGITEAYAVLGDEKKKADEYLTICSSAYLLIDYFMSTFSAPSPRADSISLRRGWDSNPRYHC